MDHPAAAPGGQRLGNRFAEALQFATQLHSAQVRKGSRVPYVAHLLSVCALVLEDGGTETEAIAALLHDAIEDQPRNGKTERDIERRFGPEVADLVGACTDARTHPKRPWRDRKEQYIRRARTHSPAARRISIADKLHNARAIVADHRELGSAVWDRFAGGRDQTLWYYRSLVAVYSEADAGGRLLNELRRSVDEMEQAVRQDTRRTAPSG